MESVKIDVLIEFSFKCKSVVLLRTHYSFCHQMCDKQTPSSSVISKPRIEFQMQLLLYYQEGYMCKDILSSSSVSFHRPSHVLVPSIDGKESKLVKPGIVLHSPRTA